MSGSPFDSMTEPPAPRARMRARRRATGAIVKGLILAAALAIGLWVGRIRSDLAQVTEVVTGLRRRRLLIGKEIALPSDQEDSLGQGTGSSEGGTASALLILSRDGCIECLVELDRWRELHARAPGLRIAVILLGAEPEFASRLRDAEKLTFPVIGDPDSELPQRLGVNPHGTMRLLIVGGRIAMAADGIDEGPVGFAEGLGHIWHGANGARQGGQPLRRSRDHPAGH